MVSGVDAALLGVLDRIATVVCAGDDASVHATTMEALAWRGWVRRQELDTERGRMMYALTRCGVREIATWRRTGRGRRTVDLPWEWAEVD